VEEEGYFAGARFFVGKSPLQAGLIAGFVATWVATVFGYWFPGATLPQFPFNQINAWLIFGFTQPDYVNFIIGGFVHYINGILWGVIFALILYPFMGMGVKRLAPMKPTTNLLKGLIWGWALWIISSALWMPLLVGPLLAGAGNIGPFLTNFDGVGYQAVFTNLLWHTLYGVNLGLLFSPLRKGSSMAAPEEIAVAA